MADEIAAYCWPQSTLSGDEVTLHCHTTAAEFSVEVIRQGAEDVVVWSSDPLPGRRQQLPAELSVDGCDWQPTTSVAVGSDWPSGFYLVRCVTNTGSACEAFFVVRARARGRALLVLSASTWAAYNDWGGPSFYTGGNVVSTRRPLSKGFLDKPDPYQFRAARYRDLPQADIDAFLLTDTRAGAWPPVGTTPSGCSCAGRNRRASRSTTRRARTWTGIRDCWTATRRTCRLATTSTGPRRCGPGRRFCRDRRQRRVFSGNTSFWQVRFADDYGQVIGYKLDLEDDPLYGTDQQHRVSTMWSDPIVGRPENGLTGVSFTRGGYAHLPGAPRGSGGYTVWRPRHWAFDGVDRRAGDIVGAEPVVVGYECDGCELTLEHGLPVATGRDGTPASFTVLATAPAHLWSTDEAPQIADDYVGELKWVAERLGGADTPEVRERFAYGNAVMGAFTRGSGEVFTVGCTDWAYGLGDADIDRITMNVLRRFGAI